LNFSGCAPAIASSAAALAVASLAGFPVTASSTARRRSGRAATPLTTTASAGMVPPCATIADATLTSAKSHTLRSRIFSK
jgi:hypothetical protein